MLFSDESTIEKGCGKGQTWVFRYPDEKFHKDTTNAKPTSVQVGQMVWAGMAYYEHGGVVPIGADPTSGRRGVTSEVYLDTLRNYLPILWHDDFIFMHDNAPVHTYGPVPIWLQENGYTVLKWPAYSPDLNPIEHAWIELKKMINKHYPGIASMPGNPETIKRRIADAAEHCWELLDQRVQRRLIDSMPDRIKAVIKAQGWYTKY